MITIRYDIASYGVAFYNEGDSAKIRAYMEEEGCSVEEAIEELANAGVIDRPEDIGFEQDVSCTYTEI